MRCGAHFRNIRGRDREVKLSFHGNTQGLIDGIRALAPDLGIVLADSVQDGADSVEVHVEQAPGPIVVTRSGKTGRIRYQEKIHFFRALGLFVEESRKTAEFSLTEEPQFTTLGAMFDASRNGVLRVESMQYLLRRMALMGLNFVMLYTEDTYEVPERPYFGYMRGRYSQQELKAIDDYADQFGIEVVPCIQTLAHLATVLQWNAFAPLRDTGDILLAGSEKTYEFIEEMIRAASAPFRSKRIHIGMDEAHQLGLGRYLRLHGYRRRFDIMNEHLRRVLQITDKYGLRPMMWSDMYFRLASKTGEYYDLEAVVPDEVIQDMPKNVQLVYWDYYHDDPGFYEEFIQRHRRFGSDPVFAGGVWTWVGMCPQYPKTFAATHAALTACKRTGVKEAFATMWGDDGQEVNVFAGLLGLQLFAEHGYAKELDERKLERRFEFCVGASAEAFKDLSLPNRPAGVDIHPSSIANPTKYFLWQDPLIGLFDKHAEGLDLNEHFSALEAKMKAYREQYKDRPEFAHLFEVTARLCAVLEKKWDLGLRIKKAYDSGQIETLRLIAHKEIPELRKRVEDLRLAHREQWMRVYKPFGWEILDLRYGGLLARLETAAARILQYVDGSVGRLEELEAERLHFDGPRAEGDRHLPVCNTYRRIVSPGVG